MTATSVLVIGDDALATLLEEVHDCTVCRRAALDVGAEPGHPVGALVIIRRETGPPHDVILHEVAERHRRPVLPVRYEHDGVVLGPWIGAGPTPCLVCLSRRRARAQGDHRRRRDIADHLPARHPRPLVASPSLRHVVAAVVAGCLATLGNGDMCEACEIVRVMAVNLAVSRHRYLPDPLCSRCGHRPRDTAATATVVLQPRLKHDPGAWRQIPIRDRADDLVDRFVDPQCGIVRGLIQDNTRSLPLVMAPMGVGDTTENSAGRRLTFEESRLSALTEALERYGGIAPRDRAPAVRGSYAELADVAIDPTALGLHDPALYAQPDPPFRPFTPHAACEWVWGYSFARARPMLVPTAHVFYGQRYELSRPREPGFVFELSNGCALGGSLEEALLHGLFEVCERDAFLLTWYARLPVPEISLRDHADSRIRLITERLERDSGRRVRAFDTTADLLPAVWVMAVDESGIEGRAKVVCAAGSHIDAVAALESALLELSSVVITAEDVYDPETSAPLVGNADLVRSMDDHLRLYCHPDAYHRLDFLTRPPRRHQPPRRPQPAPSPDLTQDLRWTLDVFQAAGVDVIVVDQTPPELKQAGLTCVKALAAGTLPMTFGRHLRRVHGIPRLGAVPLKLGYRSCPLPLGDINPDPHPFP